MSPENNSQNTKVCPTCGTRLNENATRCLVCGRNFSVSNAPKPAANNPVESPRLPELKISLPAALGLIVLILALGAAIVFLILQGTGRVTAGSPTATITITPTDTQTPRPTDIPTLAPTYTPIPPIDYVVQSGDLCSGLAAYYGVSIQSISDLNKLDANCTLYPGTTIKIPRPTPTVTPQPTGTLSAAEATSASCQTMSYTVQSNDTLSSISANYSISVDSIKNYNNLPSDNVWAGEKLVLPLCQRLPTEGPTPTPTTPPPYPAPSLLLPNDGIVYANTTDTITLQWSSVGTLRDDETYMITIEDVTSTGAKRSVQYATDTKVNVPSSLRPLDNTSHIFRWWVVVAIQTGSNADGTPIYLVNSAQSAMRVFGWAGTNGGVSATATP